MKKFILSRKQYFACTAIFSTVTSIALLKSPALPLSAIIGFSSGVGLALAHKGSLTKKEREIKATQEALATAQASQDELEYAMLENVQCQIDAANQKLEQDRLAEISALQAKAEALKAKEQVIDSKLPAVQAQAEEIQKQADEQLEEIQKQANEQVAKAEEYYRNIYGSVASKFAQENHILKVPDMTEGASLEETQADRVILELQKHGIIVKDPIVKPTATGFVMKFKVLPKLFKVSASKEGKDSESLLSISEAIKVIDQKLLKTLKSVVGGCQSDPKVDAVFQGISLEFNTTGIDKKERQKLSQKTEEVIEPDENWFEEAVAACQHIRVTGERDSGKSTFVSNLVDLKRRQNPGCTIKLSNPLYGSKKDRWNIPAIWKSVDEAIEGLQEAHDLLMSRNAINRRRKDEGLEPQEFEPVLYIFDEIDLTVSVHEKDATNLLKGCLTKGTHYDVHILYLGQSPICSTLKLNQHDFNHSTNFHLGQNIGRALDDNRNLSSDVREVLRNQAELRRLSGEDFIVLCDYGKKHFIATTPSPNFYQELTTADGGDVVADSGLANQRQQLEALLDKAVVDDSQKDIKPDKPENRRIFEGVKQPTSQKKEKKRCPHCTSLSTKKNGKKKEIQQYRCNDCCKTFQE